MSPGGTAALAGQGPGGGLSDADRAAAELRAARAELEGVVGEHWLALEPPLLPGPLGIGLSADEQAFDFRLLHQPPEAWSGAERRRLRGLLDRYAGALAGLRARGKRPAGDGLLTGALDLLRGAGLETLQDRLALLEGDEAACLAGIEARADLAERLYLQPGTLGPILAVAVQRLVLEDVHRLAERRATSRDALERLENLLLAWLELPDAGAIVARQGLDLLDRMERSGRKRELGAEDLATPRLQASVARGFLALARACRERGCRRAAAVLSRRGPEDRGERVIADLLIPNILAGIERIDTLGEIARAARIATGLRIEASDLGGYPTDGKRLSPSLQAALADLSTLAYQPHGPAGARLTLLLQGAADVWAGPAAEEIPALLTWDLPPTAPADGRRPPTERQGPQGRTTPTRGAASREPARADASPDREAAGLTPPAGWRIVPPPWIA